jgi:hypothetical protein
VGVGLGCGCEEERRTTHKHAECTQAALRTCVLAGGEIMQSLSGEFMYIYHESDH